ncbi:MAG TPA: type I-U CRISPR-associated protein Csx17 [Pseudonocardiaceae bacterium]|jgi:CRISPR-associated protein Csx17|nr:type I-U CRISPR-associated protein Csx17 [Pseudonocardiaceae bacterium]
MTGLTLPGCRTVPLGSYLTALGVLRAATRLLDGEATGYWQRQRFVLDGRWETLDELVDALLVRFEPESIVSPWNAGSGFAGNGKNVTAERALQAVRQSDEPRLARLRQAVAAGDRVVTVGRERGWGGKGDDLWDKTRKRDVLALCRNEFPDHALPWLDAAVALGQDEDPAYSRLLGTGGNFGRQDLSATYLARVHSVLTDRRSRGWLHDLLSGQESTPYLRDAVGQFDPGRAGGIQSSPWEKADDKGFVNPWAFLLTVEGALLFASAVVRRHGTEYVRIALPFQVHGSTAGYPTQAPGEKVLGELWVPEWSAPARLDEVTHLLAEGRAEWNHRPANSGLDFARAVATLGVDRGIDAFERHLFVNRHGQNPIALPAGRIKVRPVRGVQLLGGLDIWLERLRRADLPSQVAARLRAVDQALFIHAGSGKPDRLVEVIAAMGRCHEAVSRSGVARRAVSPLRIADGPAMLDELRQAAEDDAELRIALAFATARDEEPELPLRALLSPVTTRRPVYGSRTHRAGEPDTPRRGPDWTGRPTLAPLNTGLAAALAEAARRRGFPGAVHEVIIELEPAVKGVRIGFERGVGVDVATVHAFVAGELDHERLADLLAGLLTIDWGGTPDVVLSSAILRSDPAPPDPALDLLLPFTGHDPLRLPDKELLRPGSEWPALLQAGHTAEVLADAARRLRIAGLRHVIAPGAASDEGTRLAAVLLIRVPNGHRLAALRRVALLPEFTTALLANE